MHDILRERLLRRIESLPEEQVYQVLDFVEFLESKYARDLATETSGLQRFAERMEDRLRRRAVSPATLREAFQLISAADRVLQNVSSAGRQIFGEPIEAPPERGSERDPGTPAAGHRDASARGASGTRGEGPEVGGPDAPVRDGTEDPPPG